MQTGIQVGDQSFLISIEQNEPDGYLVTCPALPGLVTKGDTIEEARTMALDAVRGYVESKRAHGEVN
jgi:predicted RNase H-like HicB family nuclease